LTDPTPDQPDRPGASTFTIEGRSAPGLFVVGWLATLVGLGATFVAIVAPPGLSRQALLIGGMLILSIGLVAGAGGQAIERRSRGTLPYPGPSPFLLFAAAIPVSFLGVVLLGFGFEATGIPIDGPFAPLASVIVQALVYIGLIRLLVVDTGGLSWADMGIRRPDMRALREVGYGAMWAGGAILATIPVAIVLSLVLPVLPTSPLPRTGELSGLLVNLAAGAIVAPIGEEIMFRGLATTAWTRGMGERRGLIRAALFFAFAHVLTIGGTSAGPAIALALAAFVGRIPVSLILTWLFVRHRSIWVPLGLHATFNALLLVLAEVVTPLAPPPV
jgi:membrane protease YdiL (CAAX protease family)